MDVPQPARFQHANLERNRIEEGREKVVYETIKTWQ